MAHVAVFVTKEEMSWTDEVLTFQDGPGTLQLDAWRNYVFRRISFSFYRVEYVHRYFFSNMITIHFEI
jgi:hypothetical protein